MCVRNIPRGKDRQNETNLYSNPGGGFSNDLRETLTYGELLKHEFYSILRNYG